MFIDDINNRYTYLNSRKDIVWECANERTIHPDQKVYVSNYIQPILDKLAKERPTWKFKSKETLYGAGEKQLHRFYIYDADEELGSVWLENHWRDNALRFYFEDFRLRKQRQRGMASFSSQPDVAIKRILKAFHLKTPKERAGEAQSEVHKATQELISSANWPLRRAKQAVEESLFAYAVRNWDAVKQHLGANANAVDLPGLYKLGEEHTRLSNAMSNNLGCNVRIESNGTYLVSRLELDTYSTNSYTDDTLPDNLRGALGLLKLVEDKTYIDSVGMRISSNLFYVMDKVEGPHA